MNTRRFVLGITGGIATGKSSVIQELVRHRIPTVSSDDIAHTCLRRGHPVYRKVRAHFGPKVLGSEGEINRKRVGEIVFSDPKERKWLERQIHPWVIRQLKSFIRKHRGLTALDIPLLYEAGLDKLVDAVVVVWSSRGAQIARLKRRDGMLKAAALRRIRAQLPLAIKRKRADFVLLNDGTRTALRAQVRHLVEQLRDKIA